MSCRVLAKSLKELGNEDGCDDRVGGRSEIKGAGRWRDEGKEKRDEREKMSRGSEVVRGGVISEVDAMPSDRSSWETVRPPAPQTGQYGGKLLLPM